MPEKLILVCPICDVELEDAQCPKCGITQSIVELEESMEDFIHEEIEEVARDLEKDLFEMEEDEIFDVMRKFGAASNGVEAEEELPEKKEIVVFECPLCGAEVGEDETKCPGCGAIFEEEDEEDEVSPEEQFKLVFSRAKTELNRLRSTPVSESMVKDLIKQAVLARNEGNYGKAIDRAREAIEVSDRIETFVSTIHEAKEYLKEIKRNGGNYRNYLEALVKAKDMIEKGQIEEGLEESKRILKKVKVD